LSAQANKYTITANITAVGGYVPPYKLTNSELELLVDTTDEWIFSRTGIKERRILKEKGAATSDMAVKAIENLIENYNLNINEVDLIICATVTPDMVFPSTANVIADKVGAKNSFSFDINAACSGFLYALETGRRFVESGQYKKVLVVGADKMSSIIDYTDRNTCIIFGDGAGVVLLEPSTDTTIGIQDAILKISSNIKDSIIITNSSIVPSGLSKKTKDFIELGCQQGKRNLELFRSACDFAAKGYNENQAISSLLPPALNSGLDQTEIINTIKSAFAKPRVAQVLTGNYKYEWRGFPFSNHKYAMEFDIRRVTSDTPPWNAFFGETVIKANPGWITESGVAINEGKILGIKFMHLDNALQAKSVAEWLKMIEDGKKCYFLHNN
jgi:3-oxoacyl-(acyl-carrier-protein) synthase III